MSYTRKIAHNTIVQIIGKGASTVIGVVVIGMLTRYLGAEGFGQYTTIMAFLQLFGVLVDLGLYIILVKKISEPLVDEQSIVSNIFTLRLVSAVVFLGLAPVIASFFPYPAVVKWGVFITSFSFLGITLSQVLSGVFQKHLRMDKMVIAEVIGRVVLIGATWLVITRQAGLLWVMGAVVAGSLVNFLATFWYSRAFVRIRLAFDWAVWREVIRESWPIALSIAFNLIYFKGDTILLSLYHPAAAVGVYGAANKVLEVLVTFPAMFAGLVLPLLASAWASADKEQFRRVLGKAFDAMAIIALPLIVGTLFIARPIMDLIAPEFTDAPAVLQIVMIATGVIFIGNLFGNTVVALNRQRAMMWLYLVVAVVALTAYLLVIPAYSYFGAAWVRVISELMITAFSLFVVLRYSKVRLSMTAFGKSCLATAGMAVVMYALREVNFLLLLTVGAIVYSALLLLVKGITKETVLEIIKPG